MPFFATRAATLAELEPRDVRQFIAWLFDEKAQERALSLSTVRNHVAALRALLVTAVEDGVIRHNPAAGVRISRPGVSLSADVDRTRRAFTRTELRAFLEARPDEWRLFFELLAHTGVRISEALELRWAEVKWTEARLRVRRQIYRGVVGQPKSRFGKRDIPLSPRMLDELRSREGWQDALIFASVTGGHWTDNGIRRNVLRPTADAAGVPWAGFHTFRHTTASLLFDAGRNVKHVQEWLGHSDLGLTLRTYVHLMDDGLGDAAFFDESLSYRPGRASRTLSAASHASLREPARSLSSALRARKLLDDPRPSLRAGRGGRGPVCRRRRVPSGTGDPRRSRPGKAHWYRPRSEA